MKKTKNDSELKTSDRARAHGLRRIPRRHVMKPGESALAETKVRITIFLDPDVLEYYKARAEQPHAAPYQTQINQTLREAMEREKGSGGTYAALVNDEQFIAAVAERVKQSQPLSKR